MVSEIRQDIENETARFTLTGRLDTINAPELTEQLKSLVGRPIKKVVFMAKDLEYISSAGLRAMVFAKQKIGSDTQVYLIQPQQAVLDVVTMTGFDSFLLIQDSL